MTPMLVLAALLAASGAMSEWDTPRRGANLFDEEETAERLDAAAAAGIRIVRLAPDKWRGAGRDFLIGDADSFTAIPPADLARLRAVLDRADSSGVRVVLTLLSLPGARWRQHNDGSSDFRLYRERRFADQAARFWTELAGALRGHPALAAYDLLNEPHPARGGCDSSALGTLHRRLVAAVREADPDIPIVIESDAFASPAAFAALAPLDDPRVLYSFHFYEPWEYVDWRQRGRVRYPGRTPADAPGGSRFVDRGTLESLVAPVVAWQRRHQVPDSRIVAAEFGVPRTHPGAAEWLRDCVRVFEAHGWHWMVYAFREDGWHAMDYELGTRPPGEAYWKARERGEHPELPRVDNPMWRALRAGFAGDTSGVAGSPGEAQPRDR